MPNISYKTNEKKIKISRLREIALLALRNDGWAVDRAERTRKTSIRKITRNNESRLISICTSTNTWIAFKRTEEDGRHFWETLNDVEFVVAASVDRKDAPTEVRVHMLEADDLRKRFDHAHEARKSAGRKIKDDQGLWISLYEEESPDCSTNLVGAGAGLEFPAFYSECLNDKATENMHEDELTETTSHIVISYPTSDAHLSIPEAKRRLAITLGVLPENIKISVEA